MNTSSILTLRMHSSLLLNWNSIGFGVDFRWIEIQLKNKKKKKRRRIRKRRRRRRRRRRKNKEKKNNIILDDEAIEKRTNVEFACWGSSVEDQPLNKQVVSICCLNFKINCLIKQLITLPRTFVVFQLFSDIFSYFKT